MTTLKKIAGQYNGALVWVFAVGAVLVGLGASWATAGMSSKISAAIYFGVFSLAGFAALYLTRAKTVIGVLAFILAAVASGVFFHIIVSSMISEAVTVTATVAGGPADAGAAMGSTMGSIMGAFAGVIVGLETLIAGLGGVIVGARQRRRSLAGA